MKGNLWDRILDYFGLNSDGEQEEENQTVYEQPYPLTKKRGKVLDIHTASQVKMVIYQPSSFDHTSEICDNLKQRKPIIVNLENVDGELARRILDFMSGAVYALDGNLNKISGGIFLAAPSNVEISDNLKQELKDKFIFKWQK